MAKRKKVKLNKYTVIILAIVVLISGLVTYFGKDNSDTTQPADAESTSDWANLLADAGLLQGQGDSAEKSGLTVDFIDVGQGDCTLVTVNGRNMLIDCGERDQYQTVKAHLKSRGISRLDIVIATHPHSDHIGGMDMLIEDFTIGKFIMPKLTGDNIPTTKTYLRMISALKEKSITPEYSSIGKRYTLDKAFITILGPVSEIDDLNAMSIVAKLEYGKTSFLFTGDAEAVEEKEIISTYADLKCDVLKVAHHGSNTSSCEAFLKEADPDYAVISVGKSNDYGHPHKETLKALLKSDAVIYRTDEIGLIRFRVPNENSEIILPNG